MYQFKQFIHSDKAVKYKVFTIDSIVYVDSTL